MKLTLAQIACLAIEHGFACSIARQAFKEILVYKIFSFNFFHPYEEKYETFNTLVRGSSGGSSWFPLKNNIEIIILKIFSVTERYNSPYIQAMFLHVYLHTPNNLIKVRPPEFLVTAVTLSSK